MHHHISGHVHTAVQVGALHGNLNLHAVWQPPPPRQLPPTPARFTNRHTELHALHRARTGVRVLALVGLGGVGKTALATAFAHRIGDAYPDGHLFLSLGAGACLPTPAHDVLASALLALGVPAPALHASTADRIGLYRSLTHRKRLLVVADDAATVDQITPLIPSTDTALVVVTGRTRLPGLISHNAAWVPVNPLPGPETLTLLGRLTGSTHQAQALAPLATMCAGMPLAAVTIAAHLALAHTPHETHQALQTARIAHSSHPQEDAVFTSVEAARAALTPAAQQAYPLLGLHPGPHLSAGATTALTAYTPAQTRALLAELVDLALLTPTDTDTWAMHDVVRDHTRTLSRDLPPALADQAQDRLVEHYLYATAAAELVLNPYRWKVAIEVFAQAQDLRPATRAGALAWWQREGPTVLALVRSAHDRGHPQVWAFADTCKGWFQVLRPVQAWEEITRMALASARTAGHRRAEGFTLLVEAHRTLGAHAFSDAEQAARAGHATFADLGDVQGRGSAAEVIAQALRAQGHPRQAIPHHEEAIACHEQVGTARGLAIQRRLYAQTLAVAGEHTRALPLFDLAAQDLAEAGDIHQVVQTRIRQVGALVGAGEVEEATTTAARALEQAHELGQDYQIAHAHLAVADAAQARADHEAAHAHVQDAYALFAALYAPEAEQIRPRLRADTSENDRP